MNRWEDTDADTDTAVNAAADAYMEKRTFVAGMAILAKKKLAEKVRKSRQNLA